MKVLKPLLWFLVPTVVVWAAYFIIVAFLYEPLNIPRFAGKRYYYELFMQDEVFLTALKNTLKITILPAFVVSIAAYLITAILKAKPAIMYGTIFVLAASACMFARCILFDMDFYFNPFDIFGALQCGIICCLICFIINAIFKRFKKPVTAE